MKIRPETRLRSFWVPVAVSVLLLAAASVSFLIASRQGANRLAPIHAQLDNLEALHSSTAELHDLLLQRLQEQGRIDDRLLARVRRSLESLLLLDSFQAETTVDELNRARRLFLELERDPGGTGLALLEILRDISIAEQKVNRVLMANAARDARRRNALLLILSVGLPFAGAMSWYLFMRGIRRPLVVLETLLQDLGQTGSLQRSPAKRIDPLVEPLYNKYDEMVARLSLLETERIEREQGLETMVREAASTLLSQQNALNSKERLAAAGELAAQVAHDLKSPLAGIEIAITRLTREQGLAPYRERLEAIKKEAARASRLLSDLLARSRWTEEPAKDLDFSRLVGDLIDLVRYRLPENIELRSQVKGGQRATLPEERTQHVLLNVLMNAVEALRERPGGAGGIVTIASQQEDGELVIEVKDDGPGFPDAVLRDGAKAFATYRDAGTGLGLVVVRRFALDCGGKLELLNRSEAGGAIVRLRLPQPETVIEAPTCPPNS